LWWGVAREPPRAALEPRAEELGDEDHREGARDGEEERQHAIGEGCPGEPGEH
jgi:hypothetical protein